MLQLFIFQPLECMSMNPFLPEKRIASGKQVSIRNIHQKIDTNFMVLQAIHIFFEETLIEPKRADDSSDNV